MLLSGCVHALYNVGVTYLHGYRLRDLSAQDKLEHQRVVKDLEKNATEFNQLKEEREKLTKELQVTYQ